MMASSRENTIMGQGRDSHQTAAIASSMGMANRVSKHGSVISGIPVDNIEGVGLTIGNRWPAEKDSKMRKSGQATIEKKKVIIGRTV